MVFEGIVKKNFTRYSLFGIINISYVSKRRYERMVDYMPTNAEVIENLARKLERVRILNDLKECKTLEEYQELTKKYEALCSGDKR